MIVSYKIADFVLKVTFETAITDTGFYGLFKTDEEPAFFVNLTIGSVHEVKGTLISENADRRLVSDGVASYLQTSVFCPQTGERKPFSLLKTVDNTAELTIDTDEPITDKMLFYAIYFESMLAERGRLILHCSFVIKPDGKALLFAGESGVGKSTQARLWSEYENAVIVNGDRAVIGFEGKKAFAYSLPYCGSSQICLNKKAEINALVFLGQAKENTVCCLKPQMVFCNLLHLVSFNKDNPSEMLCAIDLCQKVADCVPAYRLDCLPGKSAVTTLKNELKGICR